MIGYYDYVLGLIPASLFGVGGLLDVYGLPSSFAIFFGALLALGFMLHALFVATPVDRSTGSTGRAGTGPARAD
ncbi:MAG: hypothetical protein V5A46_09410 [Haloferacaceae archaeon]